MRSTFFKGVVLGSVVSSITLVSTLALAGMGGQSLPAANAATGVKSGACQNGTAVSSVKADGTVKCTTSTVIGIDQNLVQFAAGTTNLAPSNLAIQTYCRTDTGTSVVFANRGTTDTTLSWTFSQGGTTSTVDADEKVIPAGSSVDFVYAPGKRIEGQWIAAEVGHIVTVNLHSVVGTSGCVTRGTAEVAAVAVQP